MEQQLQEQLSAQAAMMQQMQEQMQQLILTQQQMGAVQQQTAQQAAAANEVAQAARLAAVASMPVQPSTSSTPTHSAIDTRLLGKPAHFDGQKGWKDWSVVMRSYMSAVTRNAPDYMKHAELSDTPVLNATLSHEQAKFSSQLYYVLVMTCKAQALDKVINAGQGEGLEAWKQLVAHHEPVTTTRHAGMLLELFSFNLEGDTLSRLEAFERDIRRYTQSSGEEFWDNIRLGVVLRNLPKGSLREHLILNADRFKTWGSLRDEISNIVRAQATAQSRPSPMDMDSMVRDMQTQLNAITKGKGKGKDSGKSNGKGKEQLPKTPCPLCNKPGHWKRDCWYNTDNKGGKGASKGAGKAGKAQSNAGAAKGDSRITGNCWKCGKPGHRAQDCRSKTVNNLDEQNDSNATGHDMSCLYLSAFEQHRPESYYIGDARSATQRIHFGVDSCAAASVTPKGFCAEYPIHKDSQTGQLYTTANGKKIPDLGQRTLMIQDVATPKAIRSRVCDVVRPLLAVFDVCKTGHKVILDIDFDEHGKLQRDNSHIYHKATSSVTPLTLNNRTWDLSVDVLPYNARPFGRQASRP